MGHVGKTVTQNIVSGSEITDGTVTGADLASDIAISTSGAITTTGAFTSKGIDDNADAVAITIDTSENVGIGTTSPHADLHIQNETGTNTGSTELNLWVNDNRGRSKFNLKSTDDGTDIGTFKLTTESTVPSSSDLLIMNNQGIMTIPNQVYVQAKGNGTRHTQTSANTDTALNFSEVTDNTNSFNTSGGIFTAPVAGRYFIHYYASQKSNTSYIGLTLKHNSTTIARDYNELPNISADWVSQQVTVILNMGASDTVRPYMNTGGTNGQSLENEYRGCSIYLLG
tara:strand:- start:558 stop:1409 length:852 start_codon:yes stop_codon:yes gene_type:complete